MPMHLGMRLESISLAGLQNAQERYARVSQHIAEGNIEPEVMVAEVAASIDVKAQLKALESALEIQEYTLDLLA